MANELSPNRWRLDLEDLTVFDPYTAHLLAWCSYFAYYDNAYLHFRDVLGATSVRRIAADETTGRPQGYILTIDECNIVVFAGTTDYSRMWGYVRDTLYRKPDFTAEGVLAGSVWVKMATDALTAMSDVLVPLVASKKTLFTGHSLGGAIAAVLGLMIRGRPSTPNEGIASYTFGCPRIGNQAFAEVTSTWFNLIVPGDPITKLPHDGYLRPVLVPDGVHRSVMPTDAFRKHGKIVYVQPQGRIDEVDPGAASDPQDSSIAWDAINVANQYSFLSGPAKSQLSAKVELDRLISNHLMKVYLDRLEVGINPLKDPVFIADISRDIEDKLPPPSLSTIEAPPRITPPPSPQPALDVKVRPLKFKVRH